MTRRPQGPGRTGRPGLAAVLLLCGLAALSGAAGSPDSSAVTPPAEGIQTIPQIAALPDLPSPLAVPDWRAKALAYDHAVFDARAVGPDLPLLRWDDHRTNFPWRTFSLPSYVGSPWDPARENQEGITCLAAVLGATLVGVDKSRGAHDWVRMTEQFYHPRGGLDLVLNNIGGTGGGSFWYDLWPHILFYGLADRYPRVPGTAGVMRASADRWCAATESLTGPSGVPDFDHTAFNFQTMRPVDNGHWREPDGAAGVAWVETMAWARWHTPRSRRAADGALLFLQARSASPLYEVLLPFGALAAARADAERGRHYNVARLVAWSFGPGPTRPGWGMVSGRWGRDDCGGLIGSATDGGGYAFAMNTFAYAAALVPLVRYDPRFAPAVGKWMLHAANDARLFYADALPPDQQSCPGWPGDPAHAIAYEGLRHQWKTTDGRERSPYATGDALRSGWARTDFGLYGGSCVGFFGAIVGRTADPAILRLDCLATDFFHAPAFPTSLYYNPWPARRRVPVPLPPGSWRLYDSVTHRFVSPAVRRTAFLTLGPRAAAVIAVVPARGQARRQGGRLRIEGRTVDFHLPV